MASYNHIQSIIIHTVFPRISAWALIKIFDQRGGGGLIGRRALNRGGGAVINLFIMIVEVTGPRRLKNSSAWEVYGIYRECRDRTKIKGNKCCT